MGLLDLLTPKWRGKRMTDLDRRWLFWMLKRNTSYTAWKRVRDAYADFLAIMEKQAREEPHPVSSFFGTAEDWPARYAESLRGLVHYDRGLARLRQGDRTIFLYNERGEFDDAETISQDWHLTKSRFDEGEIGVDGKYWPDMMVSIQRFFEMSRDRGYLQPMMAGVAAPHWWGEWMETEWRKQQFPENLPEVPAGATRLILTGHPAPVFGIYEPVVPDGCMNYLLAGVPAPPLYRDEGGDYRVQWRLIWEDHRYEDGVIPDEEAFYVFNEPGAPQGAPALVVPEPAFESSAAPAPTCYPGDACPRSGAWLVIHTPNSRREFKQGDVFPDIRSRNGSTVWTFVHDTRSTLGSS